MPETDQLPDPSTVALNGPAELSEPSETVTVTVALGSLTVPAAFAFVSFAWLTGFVALPIDTVGAAATKNSKSSS